MAKALNKLKIFKRDDGKTVPTNEATSEVGIIESDDIIGSFNDQKNKVQIKNYREMFNNDGTVEMLYNAVALPIISATYGIKPDPNGGEEAIEQAKEIERALFASSRDDAMKIPFSLFLYKLNCPNIDIYTY